MKRVLLTGAFVALLAAVASAVALLTDAVGSHRVTPFPSEKATQAPRLPLDDPIEPKTWWPIYGYDLAHTRANPASTLSPPFVVKWRLLVDKLMEFPPVVRGKRLYFNAGNGVVHCVDAETGDVIWRYNLPGKSASTPAILGTSLFVTSMYKEGRLYALHRDTGELLWTYPIGGPSESSPIVWRGMVIFGCWDGKVYAVDAKTGLLRWEFQTGGRVHSTPGVRDGHLVFGSYDGSVYCLDARGKQIWRFRARHMFFRKDRFYTTPALAYRTVYIGSVIGTMYAIDLYTGNLRWSRTIGDSIYSSAAVWRGMVFFGSFDRHFYALDAETGATRWSFTDGSLISGAPAVLNGSVYFSTFGDRTYVVDAQTGALRWQFDDGRYSPATTWGDVLILNGRKTLYALIELR